MYHDVNINWAMDGSLECIVRSNKDGSPNFTFRATIGPISVHHTYSDTDTKSIHWAMLVDAINQERLYGLGDKFFSQANIAVNGMGQVVFKEPLEPIRDKYISFTVTASACVKAFTTAATIAHLWENGKWSGPDNIAV